MSISDFRQNLSRSKMSSGAAWLRADFHVHTPGSSDYEYRGQDAVQKLGEAIRDGGYKFAVILKHQEFPTREELNALRAFCPATTLIPGAEINVFVDALFKKIGKDYFFHCILAVDPNLQTEFGYCLHKAKERFQYRGGSEYPSGFTSSILDLGRFFRKEGALFIPAHLHQSKRPEHSRSIDDLYEDDAFLGFVANGGFDALEVRELATARFFSGFEKTKEGLAIPGMVCVASSDAHQHQHLTERNRSTWVRAETATFDELKSALHFRHRVRLTAPTITHARIVGLHIKGAFIQEIWMPLNEGLNALIGSKGSGKTAIIESIRFALNTHIPAERKDAVERHLGHVLGPSGYVECLVELVGGNELLITRRADSRDRITIMNEKGEIETVSSSERMPFPISILGWHEIEAVADRAAARVSLLDRVGDPGEISALFDQIRASVESARDLLPSIQRSIKKLEASLKELRVLRRKRSTLAKLEQSELALLQREYEWHLVAEQRVAALEQAARERAAQLPELFRSRLSLDLDDAPTSERSTHQSGVVQPIHQALASSASAESAAAEKIANSLGSVATEAEKAAEQLSGSFNQFRDEIYTPKVNSLPDEERDILTRQIQVLEETKRLPRIEQRCSTLLAEVQSYSAEIERHCQAISKIREAVVERRQKLVDELNAEIKGVRLKYLPFANKDVVKGFTDRHGEVGTQIYSYVQRFGKTNPYENIGEAFVRLSQLELDKVTGASEKDASWEVDTTLFDVKLVELFDVFDDDDVEISLHVGKAGMVPLQNLSAGQRCVAVFPLLLRNTRGPLIIDQPEDNLDNRHIADIIGPDLVERKQAQQFLVTSHNANLVVLTDADLIVHVDSDGASASFPRSGFLAASTSSVRGSVLDVLDGGDAALQARQRKYGTAVAAGE